MNISEESLREEIAKEESGQAVDDESEDEEDKTAEDIKARAAARQELLQQITYVQIVGYQYGEILTVYIARHTTPR